MNSESQIKKRTLPPRVLSSLDAARIQWYHFKAIIIAGMGLFTDAYDLFCIAPIMKMISHIYYHGDSISTPVLSISYAIALLGTATGQLVFGYLGDRVGRRRVYGLCLIIMILSSFGCGFSVCTSRRSCVMVSLGFFRFILGLGIGGDYPLSATIMSEFSNKRTRGAFIAAVFSMQGSGILVSSAVTMAVCVAFKNFGGGSKADGEAPVVADVAWRLILMIGALPAALTLYWRMLMPETARLLFCWAMSFYVESIACFNQFNVMKRRVFHLGMRDIILASPKLMGTSVEQPIFVSFFAMRWSSTIKRYDFLSSETSSHSWCIYILPRRLTYSQSPLPKPLPPPLLLPSNLNHPSQSLNSRLHQPSLRNCHDRIFVLFLTDV